MAAGRWAVIDGRLAPTGLVSRRVLGYTDRMSKKISLRCPCGEMIEADTEDELVEKARAHLQAEHPDRAETYTRDEILFMTF